MLLHESLFRNDLIKLDKVAVYFGEKVYTYQRLINDSKSISKWINSNGLEKGERIIILMENSYEFIASVYGILKSGCIFIPLDPKLPRKKIDFIVKETDPSLVITTDILKKSIFKNQETLSILTFKEIVEAEKKKISKIRIIDSDIASIIYTSGSTGFPKGVTLTHLNMVSALKSITEYLNNTKNDLFLNLLPFSFDYGLYQIFLSFNCGGSLVIHNDIVYFSKIIHIIRTRKITAFPIVPAIGNILLKMKPNSGDLKSIRYITNTAQGLPENTIKGLLDLIPNVKIFSMYGLTECKRISYLDPKKIKLKPNSVGKAIPNVEVFLIDDNGNKINTPFTIGELAVRGSNVMLGYWNNKSDTYKVLKEGYYPMENVLLTGDLFEFDDDGDLYFKSRMDEMFKVGGEKVYPIEIERILLENDLIMEAAVFGEYDKITGKSVSAVLKTSKNIDRKEIINSIREKLEDRLLPKKIHFIGKMPLNSNGKIDKRKLMEIYSADINEHKSLS